MEQSVNGEKIKQLRIKNSWSQEKLAAASGLSLRTIQRVENDGVCSLDSRQALASTLQVAPGAIDVDPENTNFIGQDLSGAKFDDIDLSEAEFSDANMRATKFEDVNMSRAQIKNANLRKTKFIDINLSNSLFDDVNLRDSVITDANIRGMKICLLYTSPSPRDATLSRMPSSA